MKRTTWIGAALLAAACAHAGCDNATVTQMTATPPDDAGDEAFVRSVVPAVLGRQPLGSAEVHALKEILRVEGGNRAKLVEVLLKTPEASDYWASVIVDGLRPDVGWEHYLDIQYSNVLPENECLITEKLTTDTDRKAAAAMVATEPTAPPPGTPFAFTKSFGFRDLVRGAVLNDNLSPVVSAWLVLLNSSRSGNGAAGAAPAWNAMRVTETVLDRDYECLSCHRSEYSKTNGFEGWDRFYPHALPTEGGIIGDGAAEDLVAEIDTETPLFGPCTAAEPDECSYDVSKLANFFITDAAGPPAYPPAGSVPPTAWNLWCSQLPAPSPQTAPVDFAGLSAPGGKSTADLVQVFRTGAASIAQGSSDTTGPNAFAFLAASNLVNKVFAEVTGQPLTLIHGFPRTGPQRAVLDELVATFLGRRSQPGTWSLKNVLTTLVTSAYFNRRAPAESPYSNTYRLPMITNPWALDGDVEADVTTGANKNGQGDAIGRRSAFALLFGASKAYGTSASWPTRPTGYTTGAVSYDYAHDLGAHLNFIEPGHRGMTFDVLAAWNARPLPSAGTWWPAATAYLEARWTWVSGVKRNQLTYADVVIAMKDRLLAEPSLTAADKQKVAAYFGVASADDKIYESSWKTAAANGDPSGLTRAEQLFAVLAETPDFMLTGLPPAAALPASWTSPVKMKVCISGEPCTISGWMSRYRATYGWQGVPATCNGKCGQTVTQGTYTCSCADSCASTNNCCYDKVEMCPFGMGGGGSGGAGGTGGAPAY